VVYEDRVALLAAYPPDQLEGDTNSHTQAYDYERTGEDGPHDWWCEARLMVCRSIRQAHDQRLAPLISDRARVS
jgi:hypothetical protein